MEGKSSSFGIPIHSGIVSLSKVKRSGWCQWVFSTVRTTASDFDLNAKGLLIGRLAVNPRSLLAIFNPWVRSVDACKAFWGKRESPLIRLPKVIHAAIFAPTGGGKGASFAIPHLLSCPDSMVVVDFKGENYRATAEARRKMGHEIVALDPFHVVTENPGTFNPLDFISADSFIALDECRDLANALVARTGNEKDPHWCDAAEMYIGGIASFIVEHAPPDDRSLQTCRGILADPEELEAAVQVMRQSEAWQGMLARLGSQLTNFRDKELSSTLTTTGRFLRFLDTLAIAESTKKSSFDPADLLTGKLTVYLVLPPEHMRAQSPLLRMWIGSLLRAVVRGGLRERNPVHFVIDEAASLGHMDCLDDAVDKYRGYMVRLLLFYQSTGQLKKSWPEGGDQTLLSNCSTVFFAVNDYPTAEYVSNRLGEKTIVVESGGTSSGRSRSTPDYGAASASLSRNSNDNWSQMARRILKPEEILGLDERQAITFTPGVPPILTTLTRYYENKESRWKWLAQVKMFFNCLGLFIAALIVVLALLGINIHQHVR